MYAKAGEISGDIFYQGDIIDDFPFLLFTEKYNSLEKEAGADKYQIKTSNILPGGREILSVFTLRLSRVILISQTCDLKNNNHVMIAPVYSIRTLLSDGRLSEQNANLLRKRRNSIKDWFYLPPSTGIVDESLIDFQTMHYFPRSLLNDYLGKRVVSLSDWGRHLLSWGLTDYLGRPIEDKYRV